MKKVLPIVLTVLIGIACIIFGLIKGISLDALQKDTLTILLIVCGASITYCFIVGEISRNNSQMDKLWSVLPVAYAWIIAAKGGMQLKLVILAIIITLWGIRLTFNFARKGAYSIKFWSGEEDYRWKFLRTKKPFNNKLVWCLFNLFFISFYQNVLVLLTCIPMLAIMSESLTINAFDCIIFILMICAILYEFIADEQQNKFQSTKWNKLNSGMKLDELESPYNLGFNTTGLWSRSRHPNYIGEQMTWVFLYLVTISSGVCHFGIFNFSIVGCVLLVLLFLGSSTLAESISSSKYPLYKDYQEKVFKYLPVKKYNK